MKKIILIIFVLVIAGCRKYPDDKMVPHFRTPEARLEQNWYRGSVYNILTNQYIEAGSPYDYIGFNSDHTCKGSIRWTYNSTITWSIFDLTGAKWEFAIHKKNLQITFSNGGQAEYKILQLDKNNLMFENDSLRFSFEEYHGP